MSDFAEYKQLEKRLTAVEREVDELKADMRTVQQEGKGFRADLDRLVFLLVGDEDLGLVGIVERIKGMDQSLARLVGEKVSGHSRMRVVMVTCSLTALFGLLTVVMLFLG